MQTSLHSTWFSSVDSHLAAQEQTTWQTSSSAGTTRVTTGAEVRGRGLEEEEKAKGNFTGFIILPDSRFHCPELHTKWSSELPIQ